MEQHYVYLFFTKKLGVTDSVNSLTVCLEQ